MARGGSLPNWDWAEATYKQGCFDFYHGEEILKSANMPLAPALALAQFQQCAEKSMKAMAMLEKKKRVGLSENIILTHTVWKDEISGEAHFSGIRDRIGRAVKPWGEDEIEKLEALAPSGSAEVENTEYPWMDGNTIRVPAEHFQRNTASKYCLIAKAILQSAAGYNSGLNKVNEAVREQIELAKSIKESGT